MMKRYCGIIRAVVLSIATIAAGLADPMPAAGVPTDDDMKALRFNGLHRCRPSNTLINMFSKNSYFDRRVLLMLIALEALLFYTFYYRRRIDDSYEILRDTSSVQLLQFDPVRFHLDFDSFFVRRNWA